MKNKTDERQEANYRKAGYYVLLATPFPAVILMLILAGRHEMTAFFCVTGFFATQQLIWIFLTQILNRMIYDTFSIVTLATGAAISVLSVIAIISTENPWYIAGFVLAFVFLIAGSIRIKKIN